MHIKIFIAILLSTHLLNAQVSLVPNGDFESYSTCPDTYSCIESDSYTWVDNWLRPTGATSDFFHTCASAASYVSIPESFAYLYQPARSGDAYAGFYTYLASFEYREYIQVELIEPMISDACYYVECWVAPAESEIFGHPASVSGIGIHIAEERIVSDDPYDYTVLEVEPQIESPAGTFLSDTANWIKISGIYVADGGEAWITIGSFVEDADTEIDTPLDFSTYAYYVVDDVSIVPLVSGGLLADTILCAGDVFTLEAPSGASSYLWSTGETTATITVTETGIYTLEMDFPCGTILDTADIVFNIDTTITSESILTICYDELPYILAANPLYTSYSWNTGSTDSAISITSGGMYFVEGYGGCASYIDTFEIEIMPEVPNVILPDTVLICEASELAELAGPDAFDDYIWSTGEEEQSIFVGTSGNYTVTYSKFCNEYTHTYTVIVDPLIGELLHLPDTVQICPYGNPSEWLSANPLFDQYTWNTGQNGSAIEVSEPGTYTVSTTTICRVLNDTTEVVTCHVIEIPNAFSPNGDGVNDAFFVICNPCEGFISLTVYNRWGELVFETNDPTDGWDGKYNGQAAAMGSYAYVLRMTGGVQSGQLTLIR